MAFATENERRAVGSNPFLTVYPAATGDLSVTIRPHASWTFGYDFTGVTPPDTGGAGSDFLATTRRRRLKMKGLFR